MREIVTIQVGSYANFIGSHLWNIQDELLGLADTAGTDPIFNNHGLNTDVLYRSGENQQGILTYTPRLVSIDLQGSLGSVSSRGTLYNEVLPTSVDTLTWTSNITTQTSEPLKKNLFLQSLYSEENNEDSDSRQEKDIVESLENEVQYWTDFSKVHYHPRSLYELSGLWMDDQDFNNYGVGRDAFSGGQNGENINDRLRSFVEECDHIQGFQFVVDDSGGFSGVSGEFLENIADEYTNIPVLLYSVRGPESGPDSRSQKLRISSKLHDAVSFARLSAFCKLIVPVGLPSLSKSRTLSYLHVNDQKPYHTSAIYASALHSITRPFIMEPLGPTSAQSSHTFGAVNINELVQILGGQARQNMVTVLDVSMPAPAVTGDQYLLENLRPLTPRVAENVDDMQAVESMNVHGVFGSESKRASISEVQDAVNTAYANASVRPKFSHLSVSRCPLPVPLPFPSIFGNLINQQGEILKDSISGSSSSRGSLEVHSIPMAARLRSSSVVLPFLEEKLRNLQKFGIARGALGMELIKNWGFAKEEIQDMGEAINKMVRNLNPVSQESSDSD